MTTLVVDVGNTSTAVGLWSDGRVSHVSHCDGGFEEASARVSRLLSRVSRPDLLAYVSVVPAEDAQWRRFAKERGLRFHQVSHRDFVAAKGRSREDGRRETGADARRETGDAKSQTIRQSSNRTIFLDYPKPETIGADRLADAVGAVTRYGAPVLVMDFGTALTAAVVTRDRVWRGGVIAPGFPLMRDYLFERTAKLPRMKLPAGGAAGRGWAVPKIGRSTEEAMRFGALVGYRGMVREIVATLRANFNEDFRLVATGGFARWVLRDLDLDFTVDPTLTLSGAGLIANDFGSNHTNKEMP